MKDKGGINMKRPLIVMLAAVLMTSAAFAGTIQVKGSDTELNAVQALAEAFMNKTPGVSIAVTGGGSGAGLAALTNGKCDMAISSRAISAKEISACRARGIDPNSIVFGIDGLSIITNKANSTKSLTMDQVARIYKGEIKNWKEVGGPDLAITLYGRQSSSGTFVYFRQNVVKDEYSTKMNRMSGNAQIVEAVKADRTAVGYVGVGYTQQDGKIIDGLSVLNIAANEGSVAISPLNEADVLSGKYPIARPLYHYFGGKPSGDLRAFIDFELSDEGQKILKAQGFYNVTPSYQSQNEANLK
jgi:phosphate transport system substrate-binding protein